MLSTQKLKLQMTQIGSDKDALVPSSPRRRESSQRRTAPYLKQHGLWITAYAGMTKQIQILLGILFALSATASSAASALVPNKGDIAWMLVSSLLVAFMCLPGLALFYSGMVRAKNALSVLVQIMVLFAVIIVLWVSYGYSLAFTANTPFIGNLSKGFLYGLTPDSVTSTLSKGVVIPELLFAAFQATFAGITVALIAGALAERVRFTALLLACALWFTLAYIPIAHMVWYWDGPNNITNVSSLAQVTQAAGWLWQRGALDFAGGTVVHINAGVAGLVGAYCVGKRLGFGKEAMTPHSLVLTMLGACLLWIGWFGFNAGSALEANGLAVLAFINTLVAATAGILSWSAGEALSRGKTSMLGAASGALAGLVGITPAAGFVGVVGALCIGFISGLACLWGVNGLKRWLGTDDALDVFGVHGVGGIVGALLTGIFASPMLGGTGIYDYVLNRVDPNYDVLHQLLVQAEGVLLVLVWSAVVAWFSFKLADLILGLRVEEDEEREGLDIATHGEKAYDY